MECEYSVSGDTPGQSMPYAYMPLIGGHKGTQLAQSAMQLEGNIDLNFWRCW